MVFNSQFPPVPGLFTVAETGQLFAMFRILEELPSAVERNQAINKVSYHAV